jgi:hypothetical protein
MPPTAAARACGATTKALAGWAARTAPDPPCGAAHTVAVTTPTGWTYSSTAPPLLPGAVTRPDAGILEHHWETVLSAA